MRVMRVFVRVLLLVLPCISNAEIYKWVDEQGRVHFGDSPKVEDKAEKVVVDVISYEYVEVEPFEFYQPPAKKQTREQVVMYSTEWCGYCRKARNYFSERKINFVEYDIEKDASANAQFKKAGGRGVPLILVGDKKMSGFSEQRFTAIYSSAK